MTASKKKVVAVYSEHPRNDVLCQLRLFSPLSRAGYNVVYGTELAISKGRFNLRGVDFLTIQRDFPRNWAACRDLISDAGHAQIPVIYELDDLLWQLPTEHPQRRDAFFADALLPMLETAALADRVTVTSPFLVSYMKPINRRVSLLPNCLDDRIWRFKRPSLKRSPEGPVVLGYMGTGSHDSDIGIVVPALVRLLSEQGSQIVMRFLGMKAPEQLRGLPNVEVDETWSSTYSEFAARLFDWNCDICIAPLAPNLFNRSKSPIKFLEYSSIGAVGVYSRIDPYEWAVADGETGFLASTEEDWYAGIRQLIEDPKLRRRMALNAQRIVRKQWSLSARAHEWKEVYEGTESRRRARPGKTTNVGATLNAVTDQIQERLYDLEDRLSRADEQVHVLAQQVVKSEDRVQALGRQVIERDAHAQALTRQVIERDEHAQALARQVAEGDQQAQALARQVAEGDQQAQALARQVAERDEQAQALATQLAERDEQLETLARCIAEREAQVRVLARQVAERDRQAQALESQLAAGIEQARALAEQVGARDEQIQALRTWHDQLKSSKAWKLVVWLRRARLWMIPWGSPQARLARRLLSLPILPSGIWRAWSNESDLAMVRGSDLFDGPWYLEKNPDVAAAGMDPAHHYVRFGGFESRDPSARFSSHWYLEENQDVRDAGVNPLVHYLRHGRREGREPLAPSTGAAVPVPGAPPVEGPLKEEAQVKQEAQRETPIQRKSDKVGIVVVSHNASAAVRTTLGSLRHAKNSTATRIVLVDNASYQVERKEIEAAFQRHLSETSLPWEYVQLEQNLGFAGGNNVGIQRLLEDPEITHICLLNSDVIVPDHWLDRLVDYRRDIISAVTNKAESEQWIPIDYTLGMDECLDDGSESLLPSASARVESFARDWHEAWKGNLVEAEPTFFCVLLSRQAVERIGLLDESFYPGGYEDDDYCLRARAEGFKTYLARDVYIHHWGSASFGELQYQVFAEHARRNLAYLENKHGIVRRRRYEKPFVSYLLDLKFASEQQGDRHLQQRFNAAYALELQSILEHYESEFTNLRKMLDDSGRLVPESLQLQISEAAGYDEVQHEWQLVTDGAKAMFDHAPPAPISTDDLVTSLETVIRGVGLRVECNFAMHAFLFSSSDDLAGEARVRAERGAESWRDRALLRLKNLWSLAERGLPLLLRMKGVVFFGGYPYAERQSDGYFQRIEMIDRLFVDRWRIYIERVGAPVRDRWLDRPASRVLVLRIVGGRVRRIGVIALILLFLLRFRRMYFHSILSIRGMEWLLSIPGVMKVTDIHGAVTEEFRLSADFYDALLYEQTERVAVHRSDVIVVVSGAMESYLRQKYQKSLRGRIVTIPMLPDVPATLAGREYVNAKPSIVYAGGLQPWQQIPEMIDVISRTASAYNYHFYCPDPDKARSLLPESARPLVTVDRKTRKELFDLYSGFHFGLILREDNVVNHVACPTKLIEYLAMGIVPIVRPGKIGDFMDMGMQSATVRQLVEGSLPDEERRARMARHNFAIYERLREEYQWGAWQIRSQLAGSRNPRQESGRLLPWIKSRIPPTTFLGRILRSIWRLVPSAPSSGFRPDATRVPGDLITAATSDTTGPPACDILVQVDNFESGGLENVVLDLNDALIRAGRKLVLLVLGKPGAGVEQARTLGMDVILGSPETEWYTSFIARLKPGLVLTHYSIRGVELCHAYGIPFVQVIHNTYIWFDERQRAAFSAAADMTTAFISGSEFTRRYAVRRLGLDESRCVVLPSGINGALLESMDRGAARRELRAKHGIGDTEFVFLGVGAINHQKNHIAVVRAFAAAAARMPHAKLLILGPAYEVKLLQEIERFVNERSLKSRVVYAGSCPSAHQYFAMADAFVSAAFFEGGPLTLLEALAANLPVIITNAGLAPHFRGVRGIQIIEPVVDIFEFRGAIWEFRSSAAFEGRLAAAMQKAYDDPERPNLPTELLHAFDRSAAYKAYVELIDEILAGNDVSTIAPPSTWITLLEQAHLSDRLDPI